MIITRARVPSAKDDEDVARVAVPEAEVAYARRRAGDRRDLTAAATGETKHSFTSADNL